MKQKAVLTIAGSDPSGGAGIQADLKTMEAFDVYGMSVITALTAQNTLGVSAVMNIDPEFVAKQLEAVLSDIHPDAVKIGMLPDRNVMEVVCRALDKYKIKNVVLDPVLSSTSGTELSRSKDLEYMITELFKRCTLITPNIPETERILESIFALCQEQGANNTITSSEIDIDNNESKTNDDSDNNTECKIDINRDIDSNCNSNDNSNFIVSDIGRVNEITSKEDMETAAKVIAHFCGCNVLIKGGHISFAGENSSDDLLYLVSERQDSREDYNSDTEITYNKCQESGANPDHRLIWMTGKRIDNSNTHGTGCTLSSAIACGLAKDMGLEQAMSVAKDYITECISMGLDLGHGRGPLYH